MEEQGEMDNELDGYQILRRMGEGAQGRIFLVREKPEDGLGTGSRKKEWVMKMVSLPSKFPQPQQYEDAIREGSTMQYLHHPCVVSCKESFVHEQQTLCIVMEHCKGGDLCTRIKQQAELGQSFPEDLVTDWLVHTLLALEYLHKQRILHRDIKSENIFLHQPLSGGPQIITAQLGDFGIARVLDSSDALASTFVGTPYYMSPELFKGRPYNYKTDIWALGCVLYELLCLRQPFKAKNFPDLAAEVTRGLYPPIQSSYSADIRNVVACMLTLDPQHRPLASELLELPFLRARAKAFITAHAIAAPPQQRRGAGRAFNPVVMYHSLRDQARRLRLVCAAELRESGTETETSTSSDASPAPGRYHNDIAPSPQTPDLYAQGVPAPYPATPRFAEWPPQNRDSGGSSPSPPLEPRRPSALPSVLSDPPPTRESPLYRPIPIRAMPFCPPNMRYDRKEPYEEGPGPPNQGGSPGWSLLHRPPMYKAESAPTCYHVTSGDDLSQSGSSLEDQYGPGAPGWSVNSKTPSNWENTGGMDYYGEGLGNPRGVREMREARVKRREVTAAHRARRSPRSPQHVSLIEALDRDIILGDDEAEEEEVVHVFHVDVSSSSPELNEEGYEVICSSSAVYPGPGRTDHRGSVSDGHQVFGNWPVSEADMGSSGGRTSGARPMPFASYMSEKKPPSAFQAYRRPPQAVSAWKPYESASRGSEQVGKAGMRPAAPLLRPETVSPHKPLRQPVSDSALLPTPEGVTIQYKSPSPPVGPPPKSLRPAVTVRSRRAVNPVSVPSRESTPPQDPSVQPSRIRTSKLHAAADAPPPGSRSEGSGDLPASDGRSTSPEEGEAEGRNGSSEGRDSNGSSGGGSSTEARSASSSGTVHGGSGSSSGMSSKHFDISVSQAVREEAARRIERGAATARRERVTRDGTSGATTSAGEYAPPAKPRGRSLKEASGEFMLQNRRHHSEGERALAQGLPRAQASEGRASSLSKRPPRAGKGGVAEGAASQGEETEKIRYGPGLGSDTTSSHHPFPRPVSSASEGARDLPARTGHFVRRAHNSTATPLVHAPLNKAPVSASAPPSARHSLGGPVSSDGNSLPRAFQRGAAYYSDGGDDGNEPSTSGQVAADDRRRKAGLRPREHPLFADRTEGRARFEYDLAHMHGGGQSARRCTIGGPGGAQKEGVSSQATAKESSAYQAPLLLNEARGTRRSWKEEARSAGVEWWRLPPITSPPQPSLEGGR